MKTTNFQVKPNVKAIYFGDNVIEVDHDHSTVEITLEYCTDADVTQLFEQFVDHDTEVK